MRAYLLGYNHGTNDGYHSTLIERGGCEKSYDESLDVEYVAVDEVLEIIDQAQYKTITLADGSYVLHTDRSVLRDTVLDLKGGEQDAEV